MRKTLLLDCRDASGKTHKRELNRRRGETQDDLEEEQTGHGRGAGEETVGGTESEGENELQTAFTQRPGCSRVFKDCRCSRGGSVIGALPDGSSLSFDSSLVALPILFALSHSFSRSNSLGGGETLTQLKHRTGFQVTQASCKVFKITVPSPLLA